MPETAKNIITDMKKQTAQWRQVAQNIGLSKSEINKMECAFKI